MAFHVPNSHPSYKHPHPLRLISFIPNFPSPLKPSPNQKKKRKMGFPTLCYCVLLPTPMIVLLQILDQIRLLLSTLLHFLGLSSFLHVQTTDPTHQITFGDIPCLPITPHSIKTRLQVVKFSAFCSRSQAKEQEQACAVCLSGLEGRHEVRVLGNCTHAFHKGCIDKWIDLGQVTCPLCRSRLLPRGGPGWWPPLLPSL